MRAGMLLFATGGAISGYDWLRSRRIASPSAPAEDQSLDLLDGDLPEEAALGDEPDS
jgi:hypothetical protein